MATGGEVGDCLFVFQEGGFECGRLNVALKRMWRHRSWSLLFVG